MEFIKFIYQNNMFIHPEQKSNELFFTNCNIIQFNKINYKSKRMGQIAYDGEGRQLDSANWFPVFVEENELKSSKVSLNQARKNFKYQYEKV